MFIESLQPSVRDRYSSLCQALREEYSVHTDPGSAMFSALGIQQKRNESLRDYYRRLRAVYFQGRSAPGLEEDHSLKYLFLHNLHDSKQGCSSEHSTCCQLPASALVELTPPKQRGVTSIWLNLQMNWIGPVLIPIERTQHLAFVAFFSIEQVDRMKCNPESTSARGMECTSILKNTCA